MKYNLEITQTMNIKITAKTEEEAKKQAMQLARNYIVTPDNAAYAVANLKLKSVSNNKILNLSDYR